MPLQVHRTALFVAVFAALSAVPVADAAPPAEAPSLGKRHHAGGAPPHLAAQKSEANAGSATADPLELQVKQLRRSSEILSERASALRQKAEAPDLAPAQAGKFREDAAMLERRSEEIGKEATREDEMLKTPEGRRALTLENRSNRAKATRDRLKRRWGKTLEHKAAQEELRRHAARMAKLERIRVLAKSAGSTEQEERCQKLWELEQQRHRRTLESLQSGQAPAAPPSGAPLPEGTEAR